MSHDDPTGEYNKALEQLGIDPTPAPCVECGKPTIQGTCARCQHRIDRRNEWLGTIGVLIIVIPVVIGILAELRK